MSKSMFSVRVDESIIDAMKDLVGKIPGLDTESKVRRRVIDKGLAEVKKEAKEVK